MGEPNTLTSGGAGASQPRPTPTGPSLSQGARSEPTALPLPSPETVLSRAERDQSRRTAVAGMFFNVLGLVVLPFLGGDGNARPLCGFALAAAFFNNAWLLLFSSRESSYRERYLISYFAFAAVLNTAIIYYLGVIGPVLVMLVLNVYTACLGYGRRVARVTLAGSIAPVLLLGGLMSAGLLRDPGLVTLAPGITDVARAVIVCAFALFLSLVYVQARAARQLTVASLRERDDAVRRASYREALFLEARQDLERALSNGGLGRFTEQQLGSYRLGAVIGRGGMGEVYEAVHVQTGAAAAVKLLLPEVLARPGPVRRFMREVKIAASFESPHVVKVLEVGDESAPLPYLAMERLRGEDLSQLLRREGRLAPAAVVELVRHVALGLEAASRAGIVHRDLKPQNVFRNQGDKAGDPPVWKILDFGVATLDDQSGTLTMNQIVGTPQYMAPEQARHGTLDGRTDLHALGAIAYRALTGHLPFSGRDATEVLTVVQTRMPIRPGALVRLPREVDRALAIALAKDPADRFATGSELAEAFAASVEGALPRELEARAAAVLAKHPWSRG